MVSRLSSLPKRNPKEDEVNVTESIDEVGRVKETLGIPMEMQMRQKNNPVKSRVLYSHL